MTDKNCIFCRIAAGEIPSGTIYEDQAFKVIMDISPASRGHAVILTKNHAADIFELPEQDASRIFVVAKRVAMAMKKVLGCEGINILQNNGELAGQTVFHLHVHLIPRYKDDMVNIKWINNESDSTDLELLARSLREAVEMQ